MFDRLIPIRSALSHRKCKSQGQRNERMLSGGDNPPRSQGKRKSTAPKAEHGSGRPTPRCRHSQGKCKGGAFLCPRRQALASGPFNGYDQACALSAMVAFSATRSDGFSSTSSGAMSTRPSWSSSPWGRTLMARASGDAPKRAALHSELAWLNTPASSHWLIPSSAVPFGITILTSVSVNLKLSH